MRLTRDQLDQEASARVDNAVTIPRGGQRGQCADVGALVAQGGTEAVTAVRGAQAGQRQGRVGGVEPARVGQVGETQSRAGGQTGSLAHSLVGAERTVERYSCHYGPSRHLGTLSAHGLRFSGRDAAGRVRMAELPGHPFFLTSLFQPELHGDGSRPHPLVRGPARAAVGHAARCARPRPV